MSELYCVNCKAISPPENVMSHCSAGMKHDWIKSHKPADQPAPDLVEAATQFLQSCGEDSGYITLAAANGLVKYMADFANLHASQQNADLSSRLAEAEAVIDAFWTAQADRMAQEYRERYPKGENL